MKEWSEMNANER